jgi:mRNA interferase MazF
MKHRIVLVPFPFDDLSGSKLRPALCLTPVIGTYRHVVVAFITSQVSKATEPSDLVLLSTGPDFNQTGLKVDSAVRLHRLVAIPIRLMQRQLGVLPVTYQHHVDSALKRLFGI